MELFKQLTEVKGAINKMKKSEAKRVLQEAYQYLSSIEVKGQAVYPMANAMGRLEGLYGEIDTLEDDTPSNLPQPTPEQE